MRLYWRLAKAMEPYADYYLASEETEGGYGWFFKSGFGMLAENPGLSTEEFGGVLTDVYQRVMTTEQIEMKIE